MPIYTYRCKDCGSVSDFLVGVVADKEKLQCKKCGSKKVERALTSFSVGSSNGSSGSSASICPTGTCPLG